MKKMRKVSKLLSLVLTLSMLAAEIPQPLMSYAAEPVVSVQPAQDEEEEVKEGEEEAAIREVEEERAAALKEAEAEEAEDETVDSAQLKRLQAEEIKEKKALETAVAGVEKEIAADPVSSEPVVSLAATSEDDFTWDDAGTTITKYNGTDTTVVIPKKAVAIGEGAFKDNTTIISLAFESGSNCTSIGNNAFSGCTALATITLDDNIETIGRYSFYNCALTELTIPVNVTSIDYGAFMNNAGLSKVTINSTKLSSAGCSGYSSYDTPFKNCAIEEITLGSRMSSIPANLFRNAGLAINTTVIIPSSVTSIGDYAFAGASNLSGVTLSDNVEKIGTSAFEGTALSAVELPDSLDSIGNYAFYGCKLQEITIPKNVISIGYGAFQNNTKLAKVTINSTKLNTAGYSGYDKYDTPFKGCAIEEVIFNDTMTLIPANLFRDAGFEVQTKIEIPASVTEIGSYAFSPVTNIVSVSFNSAIETIRSNAFNGCTGITNVEYAGTEAAWADVTIESGNDPILNPNKFWNQAKPVVHTHTWKKESVSWNGSFTEAPTKAEFTLVCEDDETHTMKQEADSIVKLTDSSSQKSYKATLTVDEQSFEDTVTYYPEAHKHTWELVSFDWSNFDGISGTGTVSANFACTSADCNETEQVPAQVTKLTETDTTITYKATAKTSDGSKEASENKSYEKELEDDDFVWEGTVIVGYKGNGGAVVIPARATAIGDAVFKENKKITALSFESGSKCKKIGREAFYSCWYLKTASLPDALEELDFRAFGVTGLKEINLPASLKKIGNNAFACSMFESITIPSNVEEIGSNSFHTSTNLREVRIESTSLIKAGDAYSGPFNECKITNVIFPAGITTIPAYLFNKAGFSSDAKIVIPDTVTQVNKMAFADVNSLTSITFPVSLLGVEENAFDGCTGLSEVIYKGSEKQWQDVRIENGNDAINPPTKYLSQSAPAASEDIFKWDGNVIVGYNGSPVDIVIPRRATAIGAGAFESCRTLKSVSFENVSNCKSIGNNAFRYCWNLSTVSFADGITSIGDEAFNGRIGNVTLPASLVSIGEFAFFRGNITELTIPSSVETIGFDAFGGNTGLTKLTIESTKISPTDGYAFSSAKISELSLPGGMKEIPEGLFWRAGFAEGMSIVLPDTVESIGTNAFAFLNNLQSITLPKALKRVDSFAFYDCYDLSEVIFAGSEKGWRAVEIASFNDAIIHPTKFMEEDPFNPEEDLKWNGNVIVGYNRVTANMIIPARATKIADSVFKGNSTIVSVSFEEGSACTEIGASAFGGCSSLANVSLPDGIVTIGANAFENDTLIEGILFPKSLTMIGASAFNGCTAIERVVYAGSPKAWTNNVKLASGNDTVKDPTEYLEEDPASGNTVDYDKDVWGFKNFGAAPMPVSSTDLLTFLKSLRDLDVDVSVRNEFEDFFLEGSEGHCYGFATSSIANKMGYRNIATNLHDVSKVDGQSVLACFQTMQIFPAVWNARVDFWSKATSEQIKSIITAARNVEKNGPALLAYGAYNWGGHAVTITGIEEGSFMSYTSGHVYDTRVNIYDSNAVSHNIMADLYIDTSRNRWEIPGYGIGNGYALINNTGYFSLLTTDSDLIYPVKFNDYKINALSATAVTAAATGNDVPTVISVNNDETIRVEKGSWYVVFDKNSVIDSSTEVIAFHDLGYVEGEDNNMTLNVIIPDGLSGKITVTPEGLSSGTLDYTLLTNDFYMNVEAKDGGAVVISDNGSFTLQGNSDDYNIKLALDDQPTGSYDTYEFSGEVSGDISVDVNDEGGLTVEGDNLNGLVVEESDLDGGETITITEDTDSVDISGEKSEAFSVSLADTSAEYVYTGSAITPAIEVRSYGALLTEGVDYKVVYKNNVNASAKKPATITVSGTGNYSGKATAEFIIKAKNIAEDDTVGDTLSVQDNSTDGTFYVLDGKKAAPVLTYGGYTLAAKDYSVKDPAGKVSSSTTSITIEGKGNFTGTRVIPVTVINSSEQKKLKVSVNAGSLVYDGTEKKPAGITVTDSRDKSKTLVEGTDYEIRYPKNITDAGTVKITVAGKGLYTGSVKANYKILPLAEKDAAKFNVRVTGDATYKSGGVTPELMVTYGEQQLTSGKDYKVSYAGNKKAGSSAKYTVTFLGNYKGSAKLSNSFTIGKASLSGASVTAADKIYSKPNTYASAPVVYINGTQIAKGEYTVKYYNSAGAEINSKNKLDLGTADSATVTVKVEAKENGSYSGSATGTYKVVKLKGSKTTYTDISKAKVTIMPKGQTSGKKLSKLSYTGSEITFATTDKSREGDLIVTVGKGASAKTLTYGVDYTVTYVNNVNKGKATMIITGVQGSGYAGSKSVSFTIGTRDVGLVGDLLKKLFG